MSRFDALLFIAAAALASCAPSAQEIQDEFDEVVAQSNACAEASECVLVSPGCPLGCTVAVNRDSEAAVKAKAAELIQSYESSGVSCNYGCIQPGPLACEAGRCVEGMAP